MELNEQETIQAQNDIILKYWGKFSLLTLAEKAGISFHALRKRLSKLRREGVMLPHKRKIDAEKKRKMQTVRAAKSPKAKRMPLAEKPKVPKQRTVSEKMPNLLKLKGSDKVATHNRDEGKVTYKVDRRTYKMCYPSELPAMRAMYPEFNPQPLVQ